MIATFDDIVAELHDLTHLLSIATRVLEDMDYSAADGTRNIELDRIAAMTRIARTKADLLMTEIDHNQGAIVSSLAPRAAA